MVVSPHRPRWLVQSDRLLPTEEVSTTVANNPSRETVRGEINGLQNPIVWHNGMFIPAKPTLLKLSS
uniref:Transposase n=1 Tax=Ascaris lumbricoides TaxID=6252 RepID=A0A0M3ISX6_ASCLU